MASAPPVDKRKRLDGYRVRVNNRYTVISKGHYQRNQVKEIEPPEMLAEWVKEALKDANRKPKGRHSQNSNTHKRKNHIIDNFCGIFQSTQGEMDRYLYYQSKDKWHKRAPKLLTLTIPCQKQSVYHQAFKDNKFVPRTLADGNFSPLNYKNSLPYNDEFIKKTALNNILKALVKSHNLKCYIWTAEAQERGDLHFHLFLDVFIPEAKIRNLWFKNLLRIGALNYGVSKEEFSRLGRIEDISDISACDSILSSYLNNKRDEEGNLIHKHDPDKRVRDVIGNHWGCSDNLRFEALKISNYLHSDFKQLQQSALKELTIFNRPLQEGEIEAMSNRYIVAKCYITKKVKRTKDSNQFTIIQPTLNHYKLLNSYYLKYAREIWNNEKVTKGKLEHLERVYSVELALKCLVNLEVYERVVPHYYYTMKPGLKSRKEVEEMIGIHHLPN